MKFELIENQTKFQNPFTSCSLGGIPTSIHFFLRIPPKGRSTVVKVCAMSISSIQGAPALLETLQSYYLLGSALDIGEYSESQTVVDESQAIILLLHAGENRDETD